MGGSKPDTSQAHAPFESEVVGNWDTNEDVRYRGKDCPFPLLSSSFEDIRSKVLKRIEQSKDEE